MNIWLLQTNWITNRLQIHGVFSGVVFLKKDRNFGGHNSGYGGDIYGWLIAGSRSGKERIKPTSNP